MNRKEIYQNTKLFLRPRWKNIIIITATTYLTVHFIALLTSLITVVSIFVMFEITASTIQTFTDTVLLSNAVFTSISIIYIAVGIISSINMAGLSMGMYESYKNDSELRLKEVLRLLKDNFMSVILIVLFVDGLNLILSLFPYVKFIAPLIIYLLKLFLSFSFFIIVDQDFEKESYPFILSCKKVKQNFKNIFLLDLHYGVKTLYGIVIMIVSFVLMLISLFNELSLLFIIFVLMFLLGLIVQIVMSLIFTPYSIASKAIVYYDVIKKPESLT